MSYKVVRNSDGEVVCFGPDNGMYAPTLSVGEVISIEDTLPELPAPPPPSKRDLRQVDYIKELSPEGTFEKTIGDCIDALIKAVKGDSTELDSLIIKIETIKKRHHE